MYLNVYVLGKLSVLFLQSKHNLNAGYKEELQSVEETLKQLDVTGELEPAPKSQSSPAPMGGEIRLCRAAGTYSR